MIDSVIIIRKKSGDDIIAYLIKMDDSSIFIENPYFIKYDMKTYSLTMVPYCPMSDEKYFNIDRSVIDFVVPASADVSNRFIDILTKLEYDKAYDEMIQNEEYDELEAFIKSHYEGNDTKH